jgi:hypothetical protein
MVAAASVSVLYVGAGSSIPATSAAIEAEGPCTLAVTFLCRFVPIAPDLEEDLDLTTGLPPVPAEPMPVPHAEPPPIPDVCALGCV